MAGPYTGEEYTQADQYTNCTNCHHTKLRGGPDLDPYIRREEGEGNNHHTSIFKCPR